MPSPARIAGMPGIYKGLARNNFNKALTGYEEKKIPLTEVMELLLNVGRDPIFYKEGDEIDELRIKALKKAAEIALATKEPITDFGERHPNAKKVLSLLSEDEKKAPKNAQLALAAKKALNTIAYGKPEEGGNSKFMRRAGGEAAFLEANLYKQRLMDNVDTKLKSLKDNPLEFQKYIDSRFKHYISKAASENLPSAAVEYGSLLLKEGKISDAQKQFKKVLTNTEDPALVATANVFLGKSFEDSGNPKIAGKYYARAMHLDPSITVGDKGALIRDALKADPTFRSERIYSHTPEEEEAARTFRGEVTTRTPRIGYYGDPDIYWPEDMVTPPGLYRSTYPTTKPAAGAASGGAGTSSSSIPRPLGIGPVPETVAPSAPAVPRAAKLAYQDVARELGTVPSAAASSAATPLKVVQPYSETSYEIAKKIAPFMTKADAFGMNVLGLFNNEDSKDAARSFLDHMKGQNSVAKQLAVALDHGKLISPTDRARLFLQLKDLNIPADATKEQAREILKPILEQIPQGFNTFFNQKEISAELGPKLSAAIQEQIDKGNTAYATQTFGERDRERERLKSELPPAGAATAATGAASEPMYPPTAAEIRNAYADILRETGGVPTASSGAGMRVAAGGGGGGGGGDDSDSKYDDDVDSRMGDFAGLPPFQPPQDDIERRSHFDKRWRTPLSTLREETPRDMAGAASTGSEEGGDEFTFTQKPDEDWRIANLRNLIENAAEQVKKPLKIYEGERVADLHPIEQSAREQLLSHLESRPESRIEDYARRGLIREMEHSPSLDASRPFLSGVRDIHPSEINRYYREFQKDVLDPIRRDEMARFEEETVPGIYSNFIGRGAFGGGRMAKLKEQARERLLRGLHAQEAGLKANFYQTAAGLAKANKEHALAGGRFAGTFAAEDAARRERALSGLHSMAGIEEQRRLQNIALAQQAGRLEREARQAQLASAYERHQEKQNEPFRRLGILQSVASGVPLKPTEAPLSEESMRSAAAAPGRSVYTQLGGLGMGLSGMAGRAEDQRRSLSEILSGQPTAAMSGLLGARGTYSSGGRVHRAGGGSVTDQLMQKMKMQALDPAQAAIGGMQNMDRAYTALATNNAPTHDFMSQVGFGVMGAPREMNTMEAVGRSASAALPAFNESLDQQVGYANKSVAMKEAIQNTLQTMRKEEEERAFRREKLDLERQELGLKREKLEFDKSLKENLGRSTLRQKAYETANKRMLDQASTILQSAPALEESFNEIEKLVNKVDTGPLSGYLANISPSAASLAGFGDSAAMEELDAKTTDLVTLLSNSLKGNAIAMGKVKLIEKAKPGLYRSQKANKYLINEMRNIKNLAVDQANFITDAFDAGINSNNALSAYEKYTKYIYDHPGKQVSPWDFLNDQKGGVEKESKTNIKNETSPSSDYENLSDDELTKIVRGGR